MSQLFNVLFTASGSIEDCAGTGAWVVEESVPMEGTDAGNWAVSVEGVVA